jgi:hypothetical protein
MTDAAWIVSKCNVAPTTSSESPIAWAREVETGQLKYILELSRHQRGFNCGCTCLGCGTRLQAINAGKDSFIKRPHFRHDKGHLRNNCQVLSAQKALIAQLTQQGELLLPRRNYGAQLQGLSGNYHQAWVEAPPQRIKITEYVFHDELLVHLSLDDDREIMVRLIGSAEKDRYVAEAPSIATILVLVDDPEVSMLSPEALRKVLEEAIAEGVWCSHWDDEQLKAEAFDKALSDARSKLDWSDDEPEHYGPGRQESYLHRLAKEVLAEAKKIRVPQLLTGWGSPQRPECIFTLSNVRLEQTIGAVRPDLYADYEGNSVWGSGKVMIEICVTHAVNEEKLAKLRGMRTPVLEVDFSATGGTLRADEFGSFLIEETAIKHWVYHPDRIEYKPETLTLKPSEPRSVPDPESLVSSRQAVLEMLEVYGQAYAQWKPGHFENDRLVAAKLQLKLLTDQLASRGYPELKERIFLDVVMRILSIKNGRPVGYKFNTTWQVINAILQDQYLAKSWHTLYLMAIKCYQPSLPQKGQSRVKEWRQEVLKSLQKGEVVYRRSHRLDQVLSILFPEMGKGIATPLPQKQLLPQDLWLTGKDLDEWIRKNPEAAKSWAKAEEERLKLQSNNRH